MKCLTAFQSVLHKYWMENCHFSNCQPKWMLRSVNLFGFNYTERKSNSEESAFYRQRPYDNNYAKKHKAQI